MGRSSLPLPTPATARPAPGAASAWHIAARVAAGLIGGYALTWGFCAAGIAAAVALGIDFHEAETGVLIAGFLVYLGALLWTFAAARLARVWAVLAGGALLLGASASLLQRAVLAGAVG